MSIHCKTCGSLLEDNRCRHCRERSLKLGGAGLPCR